MDKSEANNQAALQRQKILAEYDLDYRCLQEELAGLAHLAAQIAGTSISMVNLLDAYESWTVAHQGFELSAMALEDTVCAYTVQSGKDLEISSLSSDDRFAARDFVNIGGLNYYYGVPLNAKIGNPIGTLCVFDQEEKVLNEQQKSMLQLIAREVMHHLELKRDMKTANTQIQQLLNERRIIAHDIRGPVAGMIGLAQVINDPEQTNSAEEKTEYIRLIEESGQRVLELADEVLRTDIKDLENTTTLKELESKFLQLFMPRLKEKAQKLHVRISEETAVLPFIKTHINQIIGNLLSNAIKFTPLNGLIHLELELNIKKNKMDLLISVSDNGQGISSDRIAQILAGNTVSTNGTTGETGYGLGLQLVRTLVDELTGELTVHSQAGQGTTFTILLPVWQQLI